MGSQLVSYDKYGKERLLEVTADGRIVVLSQEHHEIHEGYSYRISDYFDIPASTTANATG